jgi:hypothetical protein
VRRIVTWGGSEGTFFAFKEEAVCGTESRPAVIQNSERSLTRRGMQTQPRLLIKDQAKDGKIRAVPFEERPEEGPEPYNASELVAIADSQFLFCDNNLCESLYELRLNSEGKKVGPLIPWPMNGISEHPVDDLEALALVEHAGKQWILASPSMSLKIRKDYKGNKKKKKGKEAPQRYGFVKIEVIGQGELKAEVIPDFRSWVIEKVPELGKAPRYIPDDSGLNIEGLAWDPRFHTALFGCRTPLLKGMPMVLRVRVKRMDGGFNVDNLEMLPPVALHVEPHKDPQGVRCIEFDPTRGSFLVVVGNSTSASKAPFQLYSWDGNERGRVERFEGVRFHKKMRVEGVTHGTIGGRGAIVFVDDKGGYQLLWDDDRRLAMR